MTLRELIDAIDREAEKALIGHRLDLDCELEVAGSVTGYNARGLFFEKQVQGKALRLERVGARVILRFEE